MLLRNKNSGATQTNTELYHAYLEELEQEKLPTETIVKRMKEHPFIDWVQNLLDTGEFEFINDTRTRYVNIQRDLNAYSESCRLYFPEGLTRKEIQLLECCVDKAITEMPAATVSDIADSAVKSFKQSFPGICGMRETYTIYI